MATQVDLFSTRLRIYRSDSRRVDSGQVGLDVSSSEDLARG